MPTRGFKAADTISKWVTKMFTNVGLNMSHDEEARPAGSTDEKEQLKGHYLRGWSGSVAYDLAAVGARGAASTHEPALSFGVAADGSGVPFHFHNDGFSEVQHGAKRWLLYPSKPPHYDVNATSTQWLERVSPKLTRRERPYDCTIEPGDLLYFPSNWYHAIVNQGVTVFMSTFL